MRLTKIFLDGTIEVSEIPDVVIPPPPESGVQLTEDPRDSWSLDDVLRATIRARKLQRLVTGWREEGETTIAPVESLLTSRAERRRIRREAFLEKRREWVNSASWSSSRGSRDVR
jgi:hypothetical protein